MWNSLARTMRLVFAVLLILLFPALAWPAGLPINKELTVRLSTLAPNGSPTKVADVKATTDAMGKITFSFALVPDSTIISFLHLQIVDGDRVLRRCIIPAPAPGGNMEAGISEVSDVQARVALRAAALSGRLTAIHLLLAQTAFRSTGFSDADVAQGGAAVAAAADAFEEVITGTDGGAAKLPGLRAGLVAGLGRAAALYRKSVDDAVTFDPKVEAYVRGEAFAGLMRSFINAGADVGLPLDVFNTAFAAAAAAVEAAVSSLSVDAIEAIRAGFITGIIQSDAYRYFREQRDSLTAIGIFPGRFNNVLVNLNNLDERFAYSQKGSESQCFSAAILLDRQATLSAEYNALAMRDLTVVKFGFEMYSDWNSLTSDYASILDEVAAKMDKMGGVMAGMTAANLREFIDASQIGVQPLDLLSAWTSFTPLSTFGYTPVPGLAEQLVSPPSPPDTSLFAGPYRDMLLLAYDLTLVNRSKADEFIAAENALGPIPSSWLALDTVRTIYDNDRQRRSLVRLHISGVNPGLREIYIKLFSSMGPL